MIQPKRPYLIRALWEWMIDSGLTPHIVVDCTHDDVDVPSDHVKGGKIILNISQTAAASLDITNEHINFTARFSGVAHEIWVPTEAVQGIYARESGAGMIFSAPEYQNEVTPDDEPTPPEPENKRSHLRVVK